MNNRRLGCFGIGLILFLCLSLLLNVMFLAFNRNLASKNILPATLPEFEEEAVVLGSGPNPDKIALIPLQGLISSSSPGTLNDSMVDDMKMALHQAVVDARVKAIVLHIDSPGGEVTASDAIYTAVRKARERKPVIVYLGSVAASGGYYVACGGTYLMASDTTLTGSIGVIIQALNYEQLMGKVGLQTVVFKSGQFKDMLSGSRQMTEEEKEYIQGLVMQTYGKFVGIVAAERKLPVDELRAGVADGRVISGKDALDAKLVNQLGHIEDAYEKAKELGHSPQAMVVRYKAPFALGRIFRLLSKSEQSRVEVNLMPAILPRLESGKLYFLPTFFAP